MVSRWPVVNVWITINAVSSAIGRRPDAVVAVPATFNTVNKWAAGIGDTLALGVLNEALGLGLPVIVVPYTSASLAAHPAFARSLAFLRDCGVTVESTVNGPLDWAALAETIGHIRIR